MIITIGMTWDTSNPVFVALKKAYLDEDPFYIERTPFLVKHLERTDELEQVIEVKATLTPWPEEVK